MRRYAKANRALGAFETDITRYKELQQDIQSEEGITTLTLPLTLTLTLTLTRGAARRARGSIASGARPCDGRATWTTSRSAPGEA